MEWRWRTQAATLASGGNDNKFVFGFKGVEESCWPAADWAWKWKYERECRGGWGWDAPLWKFHEHTAAVKALAWDPHVSGVLATGGERR